MGNTNGNNSLEYRESPSKAALLQYRRRLSVEDRERPSKEAFLEDRETPFVEYRERPSKEAFLEDRETPFVEYRERPSKEAFLEDRPRLFVEYRERPSKEDRELRPSLKNICTREIHTVNSPYNGRPSINPYPKEKMKKGTIREIEHLKERLKNDFKTKKMNLSFELGEAYYARSDFAEAIKHFEKHLDIAKRTSNREEEQLACNGLGCANHGLGNYNMATEYHEQSLTIAKDRDDKNGESCACRNLGVNLEMLGRLREALKYHEESLLIAREIGDKAGEGKCYRNISSVHLKMGNLQMALDNGERDLAIAEEMKDEHGQAMACGNLGIASNLLGKPKEAEEFLLRQFYTALTLEDLYMLVEALGNLSSAEFTWDKHHIVWTNHKYLEKAKQSHDEHAIAIAHSNLGNYYLSIGQFNEAIEYQNRALTAARRLGDRHLEGNVNRNFGMCYKHVGKYKEAVKHLEIAKKIAMEIEDKIGEADALQMLGDICFIQGKEDESILLFETSLNIAELTGYKQQQAKAYGSLGKCYERREQYEKAVENHQKDLEISLEIEDTDGECRAQGNLGNAFLFCQEYTKAQEYCERSLKIAKEIEDKKGEAFACLSLGICYHYLSIQFKEADEKAKSLDAMEQSEKYFLDSIDCYEFLFHQLGDEFEDEFKISIADTYIHSYQLLLGKYVATEETDQKKTLIVSEKARGPALADILKVRYNLRNSRSRNVLTKDDLKSKSCLIPHSSCLLFYSKLLVPLTKAGDNESGIGSWVLDSKMETHFQWKKITDIRDALYEESDLPNDNSDSDAPSLLTMESLVDKAYKTMAVRGAAGCEDRSIDQKRCIYEFEDELEEDYLEILYEALITPVEDKLTGDEIIIIPDGPLFKVPFAALRNPRTKLFLSENKRIRLAPSITTLKILSKPQPVEIHHAKGALIVGDPDVTGERMYKGRKCQLEPLPNARLEAEKISKVLGVTPLTGIDATKQSIRIRIQLGAAVIHFAAHGSADKGEIVLSPSPSQLAEGKVPEEKDYLLTINEVQSWNVKAKLVVLSCCHSGRGEIKSEGVVGMSRAFLAAGALAVVASLWAVDDRGTRLFMESFYTHLKSGEKASVSLQQAMKEMREMEPYNKPMFWAPFFLIGEDVTIEI